MTEKREVGEQELAAFGFWIIDGLTSGETRDLDHAVARAVLEHLGADFEKLPEELAPLGKYTNKDKRAGLNAVWGKERVGSFWEFINHAVEKIEAVEGRRPLPSLFAPTEEDPKRRVKFSGMRAFVAELTAFAAGVISKEDYLATTQKRIMGGQNSLRGIEVEGYGPKRTSIPPEFPRMFWDYLKESK